MTIGLDIKQRCVELSKTGMTSREVYDSYFTKVHGGMSYETFRAKLKHWKKSKMAEPETLAAGTYPGFKAHAATVQIGKDGQPTQVWVKQTADDRGYEELLAAVKKGTRPVKIDFSPVNDPSGMLEIPLFDMHFPLCDHSETLRRLVSVIRSAYWEDIWVAVGQDMFHNDDFRGRTSSGREIEKIDLAGAWEMAKNFWFNAICAAIECSERVHLVYSKGNHDESMGWAFVQMLKVMFPQMDVDDSMSQRKIINWKECFVGLTHGHYKQSSKNDLRGQFTIQFPEEFAKAKVREIHAGHLHREEEQDLYGVMIRRLCRSGSADEWSDNEGYVGAISRFMVFKWQPGRLAGIEYI